MGNIHNISPEEAKNIFDNENAVLIDVREPAEHRAERISSAKNISLSKITAEDISEYIQKKQKIILHCKSGKRATEACKKLSDNIQADLYRVEGGIDELSSAGFQALKSQSYVLPLDRQVQLTISLMILMGLILHYFISPLGLLLPLMAGLGLMNAALTGWCGMAKLLAKMPWNQ